METIDIFNDVLTTDYRQSQDITVEKVGIDHENDLNNSRMSFFINPAYSASGDIKPYTISSNYMQKKKNHTTKSSYITELTELLAMAEIRYLDSTYKIKEAIILNRKIYTMRIVNFIIKIYPIIKHLQFLIFKTYWYKWISVHRESNPNRLKSNAFIIWSFSLLWKKINKRILLKAFLLYKERGILYQFGIQYYGIDSISRQKLSKFIPPLIKEESNKNKLDKIVANRGIIGKSLRDMKKNRYYFK
ncbi:hypothetical protein SteCoe_37152 [Stentor coeruleus]|uniref:Uncharacterized protein n=1 Tax=Stentor coeruleus TaxID=5963 RepID=A0A1R2ANN2_9CILI|nr:hypothetical protein SteCoe_37152 [Stentor coeruleus]